MTETVRIEPPAETGAANGPVTTFASWRIRNYRLYASGQLISIIGTWMQNIAIGWLALQLSHSGVVLGIVMAARYLPILVMGPWGGLAADRFDNRKLLILTQVACVALSIVLTVASAFDFVNLAVIIALELGLGVANVFDNPTRQSLINQLVDRRHLPNAIALNSTMVNVAKVVGPGFAGIVITAFGVTPCFVVNTLSFGAGIVTLLMMRRSEITIAPRVPRARGQIRAGLRYVLRTPELFYPMLLVAVTGVFTWEFPTTVPLLITGAFHAGAREYGLATACMSIGAVIGGVLAARRQLVTVRSLSISSLLWGVAVMLAALAPLLPIVFFLFILVGSGSVTFNASAKTLLQIGSAPELRGRVLSLWIIAWQGGTVIGAPLVGLVGTALGSRSALLLSGLAAVAIGILVLVRWTRSGRTTLVAQP